MFNSEGFLSASAIHSPYGLSISRVSAVPLCAVRRLVSVEIYYTRHGPSCKEVGIRNFLFIFGDTVRA